MEVPPDTQSSISKAHAVRDCLPTIPVDDLKLAVLQCKNTSLGYSIYFKDLTVLVTTKRSNGLIKFMKSPELGT